jgi:DNA-binding transcriptional ArsR family regulator
LHRAETAKKIKQHAEVFAALGDPIRLSLVNKLVGGEPRSISELTEGAKVTRQAITKHLRVLEGVGVVHSSKEGRESLYELDAKPLESLQEYLAIIAQQWDEALNSLKAFVESSES